MSGTSQPPRRVHSSGALGVAPPATHSRAGVTSFLLAIMSAAIGLGVFAAMVGMTGHENAAVDRPSPAPILLGALLGVGLCLTGLAFAVAGLLHEGVRRTFPVLGLLLNALAVVGWLALSLLIYLAAE